MTGKPADVTGQRTVWSEVFSLLKISCNKNNMLTFNFSPVDSNFCYWDFKELCYVKQFYIKRPEIENIWLFIIKRQIECN